MVTVNTSFSYNFVVKKEEVGTRLDIYLKNKLENISRNRIIKLINEGNIKINDKIVKPSYKIKPNDRISVKIEEKESPLLPQELPLDIIYEDEDIIVINKESGIVVHPSKTTSGITLVNVLLYHCKKLAQHGIDELRPGIVHRLDKDTSGILVIAKNDYAYEKLKEQLKNREFKKEYVALVTGVVKKNEDEIRTYIGRHPRLRKKMAVLKNKGKEAITKYEVIKRFQNYTLLKVIPITGRTHQIRLHLSSIGHPVVGDKMYSRWKSKMPAVKYHLLHSKKLGFIHPTKNEYVEFEKPLPLHMQEFIEKIEIAPKSSNVNSGVNP